MQSFLYKNMTMKQLRQRNLTVDAPWNPKAGDMILDPNSTKKLNLIPNCAEPASRPTVCDPRLRTMNTQAECGSADDVYFWSPWRAPGAAACIAMLSSLPHRLALLSRTQSCHYTTFSYTTFSHTTRIIKPPHEYLYSQLSTCSLLP